MADDSIKSVSFVSLGCPKNLVDSEAMLGDLASAGYRLVSDDEQADAMVINTCGFLEAAKDEYTAILKSQCLVSYETFWQGGGL